MEQFKNFIDYLSQPTIMFTLFMVGFPFFFPINSFFDKWHKRFGLNYLWTNGGLVLVMIGFVAFLLIGLDDPDFKKIVLKPDNVPIVGLLFLAYFFLWLSMKQAVNNDNRLESGKKPDEYYPVEQKVLVWPDLVYVEFISLILCTAFMLI